MFELFKFATDSMPPIVQAFNDLMHTFLDPVSQWLNPALLAAFPKLNELFSFSIFQVMFTVGLPLYLGYQLIKWVADIVL